jgi:hypothetical protein
MCYASGGYHQKQRAAMQLLQIEVWSCIWRLVVAVTSLLKHPENTNSYVRGAKPWFDAMDEPRELIGASGSAIAVD